MQRLTIDLIWESYYHTYNRMEAKLSKKFITLEGGKKKTIFSSHSQPAMEAGLLY